MIVTLGNVPLKAVTGDDSSSIGDMHGVMTKNKRWLSAVSFVSSSCNYI